MFGIGGISRGFEREEERRSNLRRENAQLYNEFVRANPGATTQERMDFANNLINASGAGSAGLPTKAQMEANYQAYRREQAQAAAARARAEEERNRRRALENLELAGRLGGLLAPNYGSANFDQEIQSQFETFGIDPSLMPVTVRAAEDAAWTQWRERNSDLIREYNANPTQANLDALIAAGGSVWGMGAGDMGASTPSPTATRNPHSDTPTPPVAAGNTPAQNSRVMREFGGALERRRAQDIQAARQEIESLSNISDMEDFEAQAQLIIQKYPEVANEIQGNISSVRTRVEADIAQTQRVNQTRFSNSAIQAATTAPTREAFDASLTAISAEMQAAGLTPDFAAAEAAWSARQARIEREQSEAGQRALSSAVNQSQQTVGELIRQGQTAEEIEAFIERNVSIENGGVAVEMTGADREALLRTITAQQDQLYAQIDQAVRSEVTGENAAVTLTQAREDFVSNFMTTLRAEGIQNPEAYSHLAETYWQTAVTQVRTAADEAEQRQINDARIAMGDAYNDGQGVLRSQQYDVAALRDYAEEILADPAVIGLPPSERGETDMTGANKARVVSQVVSTIGDMAIALNIPMTDELAQSVINEIGRAANAPNQEGASYLNEDGSLPREYIQEAFYRAFELQRFNGLDPEIASLESRAMDDALDALGLNSIREVIEGGNIAEFQQEYVQARENARNARYDIIRGASVVEDLAPTQDILTRVENEVMPAFEEAAAAINFINGLDDMAMAPSALSEQSDAYQRLTQLDNAADLNSTAMRAVEAEISRLNALSNSAIYRRNNEQELALITRQLDALRTQANVLRQQATVIANAEVEISSKISRGNDLMQRTAREQEEQARQEEENRRNASISRMIGQNGGGDPYQQYYPQQSGSSRTWREVWQDLTGTGEGYNPAPFYTPPSGQ